MKKIEKPTPPKPGPLPSKLSPEDLGELEKATALCQLAEARAKNAALILEREQAAFEKADATYKAFTSALFARYALGPADTVAVQTGEIKRGAPNRAARRRAAKLAKKKPPAA